MSNNFIDELFDNLRRDPFNNNPTNQTSYELQKDFLDDPQGPEGWIADGVITDVELADGSTLITNVTSLPTLPLTAYPEGKVVYLTTDGKLYRNDSDVWTAAVAAVDLTGQITDTQITDSAITTQKIAANAIVADKVAADAITSDKIVANAITTGKIAAGTITAASGIIADLAVTNAKIDSINADKITAGQLALTPLDANAITSTNFTVSNTGVITASSGTIGGYTLASDRLTNNGGGSEQFSGLIDTAGAGLAFFSGATDTAGADAKFTVNNAGAVTAKDLTIIPSTSESQGIDAAAGAITLEPPTAFGAVILKVTNSDGTGDYDTVGFTSSAGAAANAPATVITDTVHNFKAGQMVSFHSVGTTWNDITAAAPIQIITTPTTTSFTVEHFAILPVVASNSAGTVRAYKRLAIRAAGGLYVYRDATNAGDIAAGSLVLGNNLSAYGKDSLATVADGELAFIKSTTPRYGSGANLYSSNGTTNINTSGNLVVAGTMTATTISATNYGLVAGDIPTLTLGTDTAGNYVAGVTSANALISVSGSGAEGASVVLTADTSPTFSGLITGSGGAELSGAVDLNSTVSATSLSGTSSITNSQDVRIFFSTGGGLATWRVFRDTSSERYKTNIVHMDNSDSILDVQPVTYHDKVQFEEIGSESPRQYGFLAEDMAENVDGRDYVVYNEDGAPEAIQYSRLVVPLHSAMRKLRSRIDELETRLAALEGNVA
jgi:hypothetical protein